MIEDVCIKNVEEKIKLSYYAFGNSNEQIKSYVFDEVRAQVPKLELDDVFENKDQIADSVKRSLIASISSVKNPCLNINFLGLVKLLFLPRITRSLLLLNILQLEQIFYHSQFLYINLRYELPGLLFFSLFE